MLECTFHSKPPVLLYSVYIYNLYPVYALLGSIVKFHEDTICFSMCKWCIVLCSPLSNEQAEGGEVIYEDALMNQDNASRNKYSWRSIVTCVDKHALNVTLLKN